MKITVFGGSGFLGSHVCDKLSDSGHAVTIFDLVASPWLRDDQGMQLGNILDEASVNRAVEGADVVFNFAGIADLEEAQNKPIDTMRQNIMGNTYILEACLKSLIKRYVFASSVYVYSRAGGFYRCSKQACESIIETYYEVYGLEYTILRYGSLYGPRSDERNAIYNFVKQALSGQKIFYGGSPEALREYIHVEDAARCSVEILKSEYINEHIILTGHQPMTVNNVLKIIKETLGQNLEFEFLNDGINVHYEISPYSFNPKIGKKLAPSYHIDIGQGILNLIEELHNKLHPDLQNMNGLLVGDEKNSAE